jgi:hypothetical protein
VEIDEEYAARRKKSLKQPQKAKSNSRTAPKKATREVPQTAPKSKEQQQNCPQKSNKGTPVRSAGPHS